MISKSIIQSYFKDNWSLCLCILSLVILNFITLPNNILAYDVFGYYLYLPQLFIHHNLDFSNMDLVNQLIENYKNTPTLYQLSLIDGQHTIIRYSVGQTILFSPFFFIGHLICIAINYPCDGFSLPSQWSIWVGSI